MPTPKTIEFTRSAAKETRTLPASLFGPITEALAELADDVHRGIPLKGQFDGLWRYRVGNCRIVYTFDQTALTVISISHRKEVYRRR